MNGSKTLMNLAKYRIEEYDSLSTEATVSDGGNLVAPHSTVGTAEGQVYSGGRC